MNDFNECEINYFQSSHKIRWTLVVSRPQMDLYVALYNGIILNVLLLEYVTVHRFDARTTDMFLKSC